MFVHWILLELLFNGRRLIDLRPGVIEIETRGGRLDVHPIEFGIHALQRPDHLGERVILQHEQHDVLDRISRRHVDLPLRQRRMRTSAVSIGSASGVIPSRWLRARRFSPRLRERLTGGRMRPILISAVLALASAANAQCVKPGGSRWAVKTSVPTTASKPVAVTLAELTALPVPTSAEHEKELD